jgi:two-component system cell cycle response regulator
MRVLIADDSAISRALLKSTLQRSGYDVIAVDDGDKAWSVLSEDNPPPLAILDWMMPGLTGPEVCRRVRDIEDSERYIYILLLTSKDTKAEIVEGLESGADDYVVKPFDEHELKVRVRAGQRIVDLQADLLNAQEVLKDRASKDLLTMLPNRQAVHDELEQELSRSRRDGHTVGVILLDLDHFKSINDRYGHFSGDAVLRETAARLRSNMRPYDKVGRYGGEEFLVVLPNCDLAQAVQQAERLRFRLEQKPMPVDGGELSVTASFGVTISDFSPHSADWFIRVADEALYRAKHAGRNCVASMSVENSSLIRVC